MKKKNGNDTYVQYKIAKSNSAQNSAGRMLTYIIIISYFR